MNWVLMKNKLEPEEVIRLKLTGKSNEEDIDRFVHIKENERQNKHFESWLSSDALV